MVRTLFLVLTLFTAVWAADHVDGGAVLDPDGGTANSDGRNGADPNG